MADDEAAKLLTELDLVPDFRLKGAPRGTALTAEYVRDLTEADIKAAELPRGVKPASLVRIHASHHALAKCLALGMKHSQAALVTGYHETRISQLLADPLFKALVEDYKTESSSIIADMAQRMHQIGLDALESLQDKLHDKPEDFSVPVLLDMVRTFADRTGHGPGGKLEVSMSQETIDRPPRESHEEWLKRRDEELKAESGMGSAARPTNGGNNRRLVS